MISQPTKDVLQKVNVKRAGEKVSIVRELHTVAVNIITLIQRILDENFLSIKPDDDAMH